ncbi:transcription factor bHLH52-like [Macadamia integrifolia]|uniref:transcription factor bHLH52-like n=1 Tax=Macadamia integrifolia TaxID=60698 RepID=UPI001C52D117|nr:transcription factor bHLH52-like [Macadamia integrifolia]
MALSFCSNWATLQQLTPEMSTFQQRQAEVARQVLGLYDNTFVDPLFDPDEFLYTDNCASLPYFSPPPSNPLVSLSPELYPTYDFDYCDYPKRQKSFEDFYYPDFEPNCFDGYGLNSYYSCNSYPVPDFLPEMGFPATEVPNPPVYSNGSVDNMKPNGGGSSAQSVAARQRRRRITEKTQELAKLIPGGNKLNTAEMFQAAFKYVKYLQAQVGILQFMGSIQEGNKDESNVEGLGVVLASPRIEEKLYLEEKCLVPKGFVETLAKDQGIKSNPTIAKSLNRLIQSESS